MQNSQDLGTEIWEILNNLITNPVSELVFRNEFELLVAVMLSAQCTDKRVNMVTEKLFLELKTPADFAKISIEDLEERIKSINFFHNKAKHIIETSRCLVDNYNGQVPSEHEDLIKLPGVGNKTANVVEAVAFGKQTLAVDTHILRVSNRLGLVETKNPDICSERLKIIFKDKDLCKTHHLLLLFGRYFCKSKKPNCDNCVLGDLCKYKNKE